MFPLADRISVAEGFTASFGIAVAAAVIARAGIAAGLAALLVNLAAAALLLLMVPRIRTCGAPSAMFLAHTFPLLVFYMYYRECGLILTQTGVHWRDASLSGAESALRQLIPALPSAPGELLAAGYMSYIPFVISAGILLFRQRDGDDRLASLVRRVSFAWAVCFTFFVLFPVLGPRFADSTGQAALFGTGPFSAIALFNQRYGMLYGGSFPSAHIAASIIAFIALNSRQRVAFSPLLIAIIISVVALRYHYRVDVAAGAAVALGAIAFDRWLGAHKRPN